MLTPHDLAKTGLGVGREERRESGHPDRIVAWGGQVLLDSRGHCGGSLLAGAWAWVLGRER